MSELKSVTGKCRVEIAKEPLHVGQRFTLSCEGDFANPMTAQSAAVFKETGDRYNLKIMKVDAADAMHAQFTVVSYKAGEFSNQQFVITDGTTSLKVEGVNWKIESVLEEGAKPFPPVGAADLRYPMALWISILLVVVAIGLYIWRRYRRYKTRRDLIEVVLGAGRENVPFRELIKVQDTQAYSQWSRDLRAIQKDMNALKPKPADVTWADLEKAFRYYLVRELLTPAFDWNQRQLMADIKKNHRKVYNRAVQSLRRTLSEFDKGKGQQVAMADCEQMYDLSRKTADEIYEARRKVAR